ncbi:MAG: DUF2384 domain-containing protein [Actinomycetota bacterium]|nr:DUF2384 domain-containing protein [Actinomycetota bacterium]
MSLAYTDAVQRIKEQAALNDADIARATGASVATVRAWRAHRQAPSGDRARRIAELSAITEQLAGVISAEAISLWLNKPVARLGHRAPADVLAAGGHAEVAAAIGELEYPTFA